MVYSCLNNRRLTATTGTANFSGVTEPLPSRDAPGTARELLTANRLPFVLQGAAGFSLRRVRPTAGPAFSVHPSVDGFGPPRFAAAAIIPGDLLMPCLAARRSLLRLLTSVAALVVAVLACPLPGRADTVYFTGLNTGGLYRYNSSASVPALDTLVAPGSPDAFNSPTGLAVGPDGNLYIAESGIYQSAQPAIRKYEVTSGSVSLVTMLASGPGPAGVTPAAIAFTPSGDMLVGRNPFNQNVGPIQRVSGWNGGPVNVTDYTIGGSLASSPGIAVAADGTLYVSDMTYNFGTGSATGPVKTFASSGSFASVLIADGQSGLAGPIGLALSGSTLFTASNKNGMILRTDLGTLTTGSFSSVPVDQAGVLALLSDGDLLVGSPSGSGNIYRIGTDGVVSGTFASGLGQIGGIAAVPEPSLLAVGLGGAGCMAGWLRRRRRRGAGRR
jgi:sugar lactone lactonase YvrE